jgi:hypothetical protein
MSRDHMISIFNSDLKGNGIGEDEEMAMSKGE